MFIVSKHCVIRNGASQCMLIIDLHVSILSVTNAASTTCLLYIWLKTNWRVLKPFVALTPPLLAFIWLHFRFSFFLWDSQAAVSDLCWSAFRPGIAAGEDVGREDWRVSDSSSVTSTDCAWGGLWVPTSRTSPCRDALRVLSIAWFGAFLFSQRLIALHDPFHTLPCRAYSNTPLNLSIVCSRRLDWASTEQWKRNNSFELRVLLDNLFNPFLKWILWNSICGRILYPP